MLGEKLLASKSGFLSKCFSKATHEKVFLSFGTFLKNECQKGSTVKRRIKYIVFSSLANEGGFQRSRRDILLEYVQTVQPEFMDKFIKRAPPQVVDAMRQTVTNMVGTLPSQFFEVTVTTVGESLAQLMYSVMMTGYMFHNAHYRMELEKSLEGLSPLHSHQPPCSPPRSLTSSVRGHVLLPQKTPTGEVLGVENEEEFGDLISEPMEASRYIEVLESEVEELKRQLAVERSRGSSGGGTQGDSLLDYLKGLKPQNLNELSSCAGDDALEAMNTFIQRLMGVADSAELRSSTTETSAAELAKLLYWLMVVGYGIRNIEVRHEMERMLGTPLKLHELPPGEL